MEFPYPKKDGFTIYTKSECKYCNMVKELLANNYQEFNTINCDTYLIENKTEFLSFILRLTTKEHKTFPMVFYQGKFVGGFTDTQDFVINYILDVYK
jgi:glutaredoxin